MPPQSFFFIDEASKLAGVTRKRIYQLLQEWGIDHQCPRLPPGAARPSIVIPERYRSRFASYRPQAARQSAGRLGGQARKRVQG